jgi:acyl transferase domain-containing protein
MLSVGLSEAEAEYYLGLLALQFGKCGVVVGCVNSPKNLTLSGDEVQIDTLKLLLDKDLIFARKLQVDLAYHSPHMDEIASDYLLSIKDLQPGDPVDSLPMISTVTGQRLSLDEMQESEYWVKNMTSQVKFSLALTQISSSSAKKLKMKPEAKGRGIPVVNDLLEIGPHSALQGPTKDVLKALARKDISYRSVLIRKISAVQTLLDATGHLYCSGYPVNFSQVNQYIKKVGARPATLPDLPEYPFDHSRSYWHEGRLSKEGYRLRKHPRLDLLGAPAADWNPLEARWRKFIRVSETPWVEDHKVCGIG